MKNLCACLSLLVITALMVPNALAAPSQNEIGIYTTPIGGQPYIPAIAPFTIHKMFFVVTNPMFPDGSGPLPTIDAFEFKVRVAPANGWFLMEAVRPPQNVDVGLGFDGATGSWDYAVGWVTPLPVVGGTVKVLEWNVMFTTAGPYLFYLAPSARPAYPGFMAVNHTRNNGSFIAACTPSSGSFDRPVFAAGSMIVPDEPVAFGSVKALYR